MPFKGQEILLENWCKWKEKKPLKSEVPESKSHLCYFGEVIPTHFTFSHTMLEISRVLILDDFPLFPILSLSPYYPLSYNSSTGQWQVEQEEVGIHLISQTSSLSNRFYLFSCSSYWQYWQYMRSWKRYWFKNWEA